MDLTTPIKAFNIDFNWGRNQQGGNGPAEPGMYAHANPEEHINWYLDMGVNTIQTFCVSYNGYAWYRGSGVAPITPGMKYDFMPDIVELGHKQGLKIMGYFCLGANPVWEKMNPAEVHLDVRMWKIPFTRKYLDYFCRSLQDVLGKSNIDGFMIDWFRPAERKNWLECEKQMYLELMKEKFPASGAPAAKTRIEFERRELERAWDEIKSAVHAKRKAIIWMNSACYVTENPIWEGHKIMKEIDWVLNESHEIEFRNWIKTQVGPETKVIQNMCGSCKHDAAQWRQIEFPKFGLYGFAQADALTTFPDMNNKVQVNNIMHIKEAYRQL